MRRLHRTSGWHQSAPLLPLLLLAATTLQAPPAAAAQSAALIVRYTDQAVQQGLAAGAAAAATAALSPAATAAAAAAAAARGETPQGQQRVAAMAAAAAAVTPAISALSDKVSLRAVKAGFQVRRKIPITTVFKGAVLELSSTSSGTSSSSSDVMQLKQDLESDPLVEKVWISVSIPTCNLCLVFF